MAYKPKRVIQWVIVNFAFASLMVLGVFFDTSWAANIVKFMLWVTVILYLLAAFNDEALASQRRKGRPVPQLIYLGYDFVIAVCLAAAGWFFYAALQVIQSVLYAYLVESPSKTETTPEAAPAAE